jgi:hypothetical protein
LLDRPTLGGVTVCMNEFVIRSAKMLATGLERLIAFGILVGVLTFAYKSTVSLFEMDWSATDTFYELIYRALLLVISVELIRTLVTHDLMAVLELLAFVVARKMLKPELATIDILLGVAAFAGLLAARRFFLAPFAPLRNDAGSTR